MQTLEELARSGMSKAAAARLLGISESKLRHLLPAGLVWQYNGSGRNTDLTNARAARRAKRRLTDELLHEIAAKHSAGRSVCSLGREYGFNETYIRKAMRLRLQR